MLVFDAFLLSCRDHTACSEEKRMVGCLGWPATQQSKKMSTIVRLDQFLLLHQEIEYSEI